MRDPTGRPPGESVRLPEGLVREREAFVGQCLELETRLSDLASLYVALGELYAARGAGGALQAIKEMLLQFVGTASYAICVVRPGERELRVLAAEGGAAAAQDRLSLDHGPIAAAIERGEVVMCSGRDPSRRTAEDPAAVVPLRYGGRVVGALCIVRTLPQKTELVALDLEMFRLLGSHAARALVAAKLLAGAPGGEARGIAALLEGDDR